MWPFRARAPDKWRTELLSIRAQLAELEDAVEKLSKLTNRKVQREKMNDQRTNADPYARRANETPQEHKERLRADVASGRLAPPKLPGG